MCGMSVYSHVIDDSVQGARPVKVTEPAQDIGVRRLVTPPTGAVGLVSAGLGTFADRAFRVRALAKGPSSVRGRGSRPPASKHRAGSKQLGDRGLGLLVQLLLGETGDDAVTRRPRPRRGLRS